MQATSKVSDQTARMRRLIWGFAVRTYRIIENLMSRLNIFLLTSELIQYFKKSEVDIAITSVRPSVCWTLRPPVCPSR